MSNLTLERFAYSPFGTFGRMVMPSGVVLYTVERPWLDNKPSVSCIPPGVYKCAPKHFFRGGYEAIEILNIPGRSHILFHIANFADELEGCCAVVSRLGVLDGRWAGLASKPAFDLFMSFYGGKNFQLEITEFSAK